MDDPQTGCPRRVVLWDVPPDDPTFAVAMRPVAVCYQHVFGYDETWDEGWLCETCSTDLNPRKFNFNQSRSFCPDCGGPLAYFWPITQIIANTAKSLRRPDATMVVGYVGDRVVGASLAFSLTPEEIEEYVKPLPGFADDLRRAYPGAERAVYMSELYVHRDFRRQGIGRDMMLTRMRHILERTTAPVCVFRTARGREQNPTVTYRWYTQRFGFRVISEYGDESDRVVLARSLDNFTFDD